jgi:predicted RNA-binding Zn-ribbon protein involved in translation (DUF1610 family)
MEWEAVVCRACGWAADRMIRAKAIKRLCPYCGEKTLGPR